MFKISHTLAVNETGRMLTRSQIWQGLLLKAENPVPFLASMDACTVIERGDNWLLRNVTLHGEDMQEHVTFEPEERVTFVRTKSSAMGTILNEIVEAKDGELSLRFTFELEVEGLEPGSAKEKTYADRMAQSYFQGVGSTLAEIRRRIDTDELADTGTG